MLDKRVVQSFEAVGVILKCYSPFKIRLKFNCLLTMLHHALLSLKCVSCLLSLFLSWYKPVLKKDHAVQIVIVSLCSVFGKNVERYI